MRKYTTLKEAFIIICGAFMELFFGEKDASSLKQIQFSKKQRQAIAATLFLINIMLFWDASEGYKHNLPILIGAFSIAVFFLKSSKKRLLSHFLGMTLLSIAGAILWSAANVRGVDGTVWAQLSVGIVEFKLALFAISSYLSALFVFIIYPFKNNA